MRNWRTGAAYTLALSGLVVPATARAQGGFLNRLKEAAKQRADSALDRASGGAVSGARRGSCATNGTFQCARTASLGEPIDGAIGGNGQHLYYRVVVDQPGVLQFTLDPMPNRAWVGLKIADADYKEIGGLGYAAGQPRAQLFQVASPGTYYVHLYSPGGEAERFSLRLANNARPRSAPIAGQGGQGGQRGCTLNDTFQCADAAAVGERVDGAIGGNGQHLYYRFTLDRPGVLQFALAPMPNRAWVSLKVTDADYQEVGNLGYAAGQPRTQLLRLASAGTYYVHLYSPGGEAERFSLAIQR